MSEEEKYPCVFGYGECPIRRLLVEEQKQTQMMLRSIPIELPALKEMPEQVKKQMNLFLQAMMASMVSLTQAIGVIRDLGPFCSACPKARKAVEGRGRSA